MDRKNKYFLFRQNHKIIMRILGFQLSTVVDFLYPSSSESFKMASMPSIRIKLSERWPSSKDIDRIVKFRKKLFKNK
jgi:hypothetical protein